MKQQMRNHKKTGLQKKPGFFMMMLSVVLSSFFKERLLDAKDQVIQRCLRGDETAFAEIVDHHKLMV